VPVCKERVPTLRGVGSGVSRSLHDGRSYVPSDPVQCGLGPLRRACRCRRAVLLGDDRRLTESSEDHNPRSQAEGCFRLIVPGQSAVNIFLEDRGGWVGCPSLVGIRARLLAGHIMWRK